MGPAGPEIDCGLLPAGPLWAPPGAVSDMTHTYRRVFPGGAGRPWRHGALSRPVRPSMGRVYL
jgi:hypothetical protein